MAEKSSAHTVLIGGSEENSPLGTPGPKGDVNIKIGLKGNRMGGCRLDSSGSG
jgi:hypothetical protein